jgi:transporter family protein
MSYQVLGLVLLSVFFWGIAPIIEKIGFSRANPDPFIALTVRSLAVVLGLFIIIVGQGKIQSLIEANPKTIVFFSISGILAGLLGTWAYLSALKMGEASRVVPISATYPLVATLLSFLILKEDLTISRILGTILIVTGIWLLK